MDALAGAVAVPLTVGLAPLDPGLALAAGFATFVAVQRASALGRRIRPVRPRPQRLRPVE